MSRDLTDLPGSGDQHDPVEEFFARERAEVRDLPAGREHWEDIVREARRPARRPWLPYAAAAAVAAVVAAGAWAGLVHGPGDRTSPATASSSQRALETVTRTVTAPAPSPSAATTLGGTTPVPPVSTPPGPLPVATSFSLVSMTNAGRGVLYALGSATCPGGKACTQVVTSRDDGRTWTALSTFTTLTTPGARSTPTGPHQLVGIRFASPEVGYVFGSTTKRTVDGGRSWQDVDVDRRVVLSLETDGDRVWMATARSCTATDTYTRTGCTDLEPRTGKAGDTSTSVVFANHTPVDALAAWITMDGHDAYLNTSLSDPARLQVAHPGPLVRLTGPAGAVEPVAGCDFGLWASGSAAARGTLVGLCPTKGKAQDEWSVVVSTDRGMTWTATPSPGLGAPTAPGPWLTSTDAQRLVAVTGGAPTSASGAPASSSLLVSTDGGRTWSDTGPGRGGAPAWAGAAGGSLVYAVEGGLSYWRSTDAGQHFSQVPLRR
ncbi:hypothetical protein GCM10027517_06930 [Phycicoccus ginsengisoli]